MLNINIYRFVARVGENWHTPSSLCLLAFDNCCEDRNNDYCINTADDRFMSAKHFANFGQVTFEILWWVCREWVGAHLRCFHSSPEFLDWCFTKHSADIKQIMDFIIIYWNCDGSFKGRCHGNRFVARVGKNWHVRTHRLNSVHWRSTTDGSIQRGWLHYHRRCFLYVC